MIVFAYSPHGICVIRTTSKTENIGRLQYIRREWLWDRRCDWQTYRTLDNSEKRQIIGMIDALEGNPIRPINDMRRRWKEIIGPVAVEHLSPDNVDWKKDLSDEEAILPMDR